MGKWPPKWKYNLSPDLIDPIYSPESKMARRRMYFLFFLTLFFIPPTIWFLYYTISTINGLGIFSEVVINCIGIFFLYLLLFSPNIIARILLYFFCHCSKCGRLIYSTDEYKRWYPWGKYLFLKKCENCGHPFRFWIDAEND